MAPPTFARTRHLHDDGTPRFTNRLADESSVYLRQHMHNPVDWWPWGDEAFAEARRRDVPVFLSVGYATCHWCHIMEAESFEDEDIAARLNADVPGLTAADGSPRAPRASMPATVAWARRRSSRHRQRCGCCCATRPALVAPRPRDGAGDVAGHALRGLPRSPRRRLPSLQRRHAVACPALREAAVGKRPAGAGPRRRLAAHRRSRLQRRRPRDPRLHRRDALPRRRRLRLRQRRQRRPRRRARGGLVFYVDA